MERICFLNVSSQQISHIYFHIIPRQAQKFFTFFIFFSSRVWLYKRSYTNANGNLGILVKVLPVTISVIMIVWHQETNMIVPAAKPTHEIMISPSFLLQKNFSSGVHDLAITLREKLLSNLETSMLSLSLPLSLLLSLSLWAARKKSLEKKYFVYVRNLVRSGTSSLLPRKVSRERKSVAWELAAHPFFAVV